MTNKRELLSLQRNFNLGMRAGLNRKRKENVKSMLEEWGYLSVENEINKNVLTFIYRMELDLLQR